jgi:hypothetical protein
MMTVQNELEILGHHPVDISLGTVSFISSTRLFDQNEIKSRLSALGLTLLEDKKSNMVKELKKLIEEVYSGKFDFRNFSQGD